MDQCVVAMATRRGTMGSQSEAPRQILNYYTAWQQRQMCVNNLPTVALVSAATGFEPATSTHNSSALTTAPPSHAPEERVKFVQRACLCC